MQAVRDAERTSGLTEWDLMQRAGAGAADWVWRVAAGRAVTVLCGPGNNGGDGYVIAEVLRQRGLRVHVVAPRPAATETARTAEKSYRGEFSTKLGDRKAPVLVDALFGSGLSRNLDDDTAKLLQQAFASHEYRIAIDVPSGVECDNGRDLGAAGSYDLTLALAAWKRAHWLMPASALMGERRLVDIGLKIEGRACLSARPRLNAPGLASHKYRRGLLVVVAGSMSGASLLAAEAAMRAGAGYVKLLSEHSHPDAPAELVVDGRPLGDALDDPRIDPVLIGPGLGRDSTARDRLAAVLETGKYVVIDADALRLLDWDAIEGVSGPRLLLTPHEGELAALCEAFDITSNDKAERVRSLSDAIGASILAKGPDTLLATPGGGLTFFPPASSWLSVAGTGDVLAGIAASRLAHHCDSPRAAEEAVWIHGEAARIAGPALTAGDLARAVQFAVAGLL